MPAGIVHVLHGNRIWEWLKKEQAATKEGLVKDAFDWGNQGPDFLFCHRFFPWQKGESLCELGNRLHLEPPENTLRILQKLWEKSPAPMIRSYILGFLCHYSADRICHPYIEFLSRELQKEEPEQTEDILHNEIESALDGILLRWETGKLPTEFRMGNCFPKNEKAEEAIAEIYAVLFQELMGITGKEKLIRQAEKDARLAFRILNDRTGLKKQLADHVERNRLHTISCHLRGIMETGETDYANTQHVIWIDRNGEKRDLDFFQLFEEAVADSCSVIKEFSVKSPECLAAGRYF